MSSHTISQAELERQRQQFLEAERQERLRQIRVATDQYNGIISQCQALRQRVKSSMANELRQLSNISSMEFVCQNFEKIKSDISQAIDQQINVNLPTAAEAIRNLSQKITQELNHWQTNFEAGLQEFQNGYLAYRNRQTKVVQNQQTAAVFSNLERQEIEEQTFFNFDELAAQLNRDIRPVVANTSPRVKVSVTRDEQVVSSNMQGVNSQGVINHSAIDQSSDGQRAIKETFRQPSESKISYKKVGRQSISLPAALAQSSALSKHPGIDSDDLSTLMNLNRYLLTLLENPTSEDANIAVKHYLELKPTILRKIDLFNQAYDEYLPLHLEQVELRTALQLPTPALIAKSGFASYNDLQEQIDRLKLSNQIDTERSYINQKILEKFQKHGYEFDQSLFFKEANLANMEVPPTNDLFSSSNPQELPVRVSQTANGIIIEPVLTESLETRGPTYNAEFSQNLLADSDKSLVAQKQAHFCDIFPEIIQDLQADGIKFVNSRITKAGEAFRQIAIEGGTSTLAKVRSTDTSRSESDVRRPQELAL
ncbi:MAG: hypothetical protein LBC43_01110 [Bifidobacteriaceae bacterium]|jgi:hypothetical protein|nr:hypothetical protein [Bifidobacteriaceae bacterium]